MYIIIRVNPTYMLGAKRMIMSLFGFRNPMTGVTLIIYLVRVIYKEPFIDKMLDALIHHGA